MAYFVQADMIGLVPNEWIVQATDDSGSGEVESFDEVYAAAAGTIDAAIGPRFGLPLDETNAALAAQLKDIGVTLALEALYIRRGAAVDEKSPLAKKIERAYKILDSLRDGTHPLTPTTTRKTDSIEVISEASRVASSSLAA